MGIMGKLFMAGLACAAVLVVAGYVIEEETKPIYRGSAEFESIFYHELGHIANGDLDNSFNDLKNMADQWNAAATLQEKNSVINNFNAT